MQADALAQLGAILGRHTPVDPEPGVLALLRHVMADLASDGISLMCASRKAIGRELKVQELLDGWRILAQYAPPCLGRSTPEEMAKREQEYYALAMKMGELDPMTRWAIDSAGQHRVLRAADLPSQEPLNAHWLTTEFLEMLGIGDRLVSAHHVDADNEVYVVVDRALGQPDYSVDDAARLLDYLHLIGPVCTCLMLELGAIPADAKLLSQRETKLVRALLSGARESEIAQQWEMTEPSLHAAVVRVYKKLGVNSRAALAARWLNPTGVRGTPVQRGD